MENCHLSHLPSRHPRPHDYSAKLHVDFAPSGNHGALHRWDGEGLIILGVGDDLAIALMDAVAAAAEL